MSSGKIHGERPARVLRANGNIQLGGECSNGNNECCANHESGVVCGGTDWPPRLIAALAKRGIEVIDLTDQKPDVGWLEGDAHPTAAGHRVLARALAEAELVREIRAASPSGDTSGVTTGTSTDSAGGDRAPPGNTRSVDPGVDRPRDP